MEDASAISSGVVLVAATGELGTEAISYAEGDRYLCVSRDADHVASGDCGGSGL